MNTQTPFINYIVAEGFLPKDDLFLVDVGASGGIDRAWLSLNPHLRAVGFDPLVKEVQRLNADNPYPKIQYVDGFVVAKDYERLLPPQFVADKLRSRDNSAFARSSSLRAEKLGNMDFQKEIFNSGQEMVFSEKRIELDEYFEGLDQNSIDFLKIDTDGSDYQVLTGARQILDSDAVLGVTIECQFHGVVHDEANLFCNIDRFLRARGFSLYDLAVHRYSRADMPQPFVYNIPAQTLGGQIQWGEALYFRDIANPDYARMWGHNYPIAKLIKLACLFELFFLPDCAVELILRNRSAFEAILPVERCLDLLTPPGHGHARRFADHDREFVHWATQRQWHRFGREGIPQPVPASDSGAEKAKFDLVARMTSLLGRNDPVTSEELDEAQAILNLILSAKDITLTIDRLRKQGAIPPALKPVLLAHLGVAVKEGNALLAEVLELIYGRLKFDTCACR